LSSCPELRTSSRSSTGGDHGAGRRLLSDELSVDTVRDCLRAVLDDASYRRSAERIQTEIHDMPDARDALRRIEALTV
jgi:UDP:flavonoid glycosyltransferase YjiC (YdhE family)